MNKGAAICIPSAPESEFARNSDKRTNILGGLTDVMRYASCSSSLFHMIPERFSFSRTILEKLNFNLIECCLRSPPDFKMKSTTKLHAHRNAAAIAWPGIPARYASDQLMLETRNCFACSAPSSPRHPGEQITRVTFHPFGLKTSRPHSSQGSFERKAFFKPGRFKLSIKA